MRRTLILAGAAVLTVGFVGMAGPAAADSDSGIASHIVGIEEFSADLVDAGPSNDIDGDFVKITNTSASTIDVGGFELRGCDATSSLITFVAIRAGTLLTPGASFLMADDEYVAAGGGTPPNQEFIAAADLEQGASGLMLVDSSLVTQDAVRWGGPTDAVCAGLPEALDSSNNPISPNDTQSLHRDFSIDRWSLGTPTP